MVNVPEAIAKTGIILTNVFIDVILNAEAKMPVTVFQPKLVNRS